MIHAQRNAHRLGCMVRVRFQTVLTIRAQRFTVRSNRGLQSYDKSCAYSSPPRRR
jgi:hypothetical protein